MFQLPEIHGAARGLANVEGWAQNWGVWAKNGGVWAKIEKVGKECIFVGKGVISLGKEILFKQDTRYEIESNPQRLVLAVRERRQQLRDDKKWTALGDDFSIYIHCLLVGGLCALPQTTSRC